MQRRSFEIVVQRGAVRWLGEWCSRARSQARSIFTKTARPIQDDCENFFPRKDNRKARSHRQKISGLLKHYQRNMSLSLSVREAVVCGCLLLATPSVVFSQDTFLPRNGEYPVATPKPGDQVYPQIAVGAGG